MSGRYDPEEGPETSATARETIAARDGAVEARVVVESEAPGVEAAARLTEALAAANRTVVHQVFSGPGEDPEERGGPVGAAEAAAGSGFESSGQESGGGSGGRIMDWDGGDG